MTSRAGTKFEDHPALVGLGLAGFQYRSIVQQLRRMVNGLTILKKKNAGEDTGAYKPTGTHASFPCVH
jgi:hypothetical protein